jgi:succinate---hydroxymethylglutarate CoA-transferase
MSYYFTAINRNKRSITLNLKRPEAIDILKKLAKTSDVFIENFVPGKADELGIGYSTISKINPGIIYASISGMAVDWVRTQVWAMHINIVGYGSTGPYAKKAGYDAIAAAEAGLMHISGHPDGPPVRPGVGLVDMATGLYMHGAITAALHARTRTGRGQYISASLFETQISLLINIGTNWLNLGLEGKRFGNAHPSICPYGTYEAKDAWMALGANNDRQFRILCERLGRRDLFEDLRYKTNPQRVEHREILDAEISSMIREKTVDEWIKLLDGSGLAYGPVNTIERAFAHPQIQAREMVQAVHHSALNDEMLFGIGPPVKFSESNPKIRHGAPLLGQNTDEVLAEIGYSREDIRQFKEDSVTWIKDTGLTPLVA